MLVGLALETVMSLMLKFSFLSMVECKKCEYHVTKLVRNLQTVGFISKQITNDYGCEYVVSSDSNYIIVSMLLLVAQYCLMPICQTR